MQKKRMNKFNRKIANIFATMKRNLDNWDNLLELGAPNFVLEHQFKWCLELRMRMLFAVIELREGYGLTLTKRAKCEYKELWRRGQNMKMPK